MKTTRYKKRLKIIEDFNRSSCIPEGILNPVRGIALERSLKYIFHEISWLNTLKFVRGNPRQEKALHGLQRSLAGIRDYLVGSFRSDFTLEDGYVDFAPHLIIIPVAACADIFISWRVERALNLYACSPGSSILITRGGESSAVEDLQELRDLLISRSSIPPERIFIEEDSRDILGSAVFTKLYIKKELSHLGIRDILLVTSPYQLIGFFSYFTKVYGSSYRIRLSTHRERSPLTGDPLLLDPAAVNTGEIIYREMEKFYLDSLLFDMDSIVPGDEKDFFYKLIIFHELYRSDFSLLRKYNSVLTL